MDFCLHFGHFGGLAFGMRWLDSALWACGFKAGPDCRREQKLPTSVSLHFEDKSLRTVRFKNGGNFSVLVWGRCQASANESDVKPLHSKKPRPLFVAEKCPSSDARDGRRLLVAMLRGIYLSNRVNRAACLTRIDLDTGSL